MTPAQAQCALHPEVLAEAACSRCGNFMCRACSLEGTSTTCPGCREKSVRFPLGRDATVSQLLDVAWETFKRESGLLIGGGFLSVMLLGVLGAVTGVISQVVVGALGFGTGFQGGAFDLVPFIIGYLMQTALNTALSVAVQAFVMLGYYRLCLDALLGRKLDLQALFGQMRLVPQYTVVLIAVFFLFTLPVMGAFGAAAYVGLSGVDLSNVLKEPWPIVTALLVPFGAATLFAVVMGLVALPFTLLPPLEVLASGRGVAETFRAVVVLARQAYGKLFLVVLLQMVLVTAGVMACFVGIVVAYPVAMLLVAAFFVSQRTTADLPPPTTL